MIPRLLGGSGLAISPIGIGNMSWPGCGFGARPRAGEPVDRALADRLVATALDAGITVFDTAEAYGCGRGEEMLGAGLAPTGRRERAVVVTKVGPLFGADQVDGRRCRLDQAWISRRCEQSLRRLGTGYIDLYLAHWPDPATPVEETMGAFEALVRKGLIRGYGVSNFSPDQLKRAARAGKPGVTQNAYSLVERDLESTLLPICREESISLMAYSPLAKGILAGAYSLAKLPPSDDPRRKDWHFDPANYRRHVEVATSISRIAERLGTTPSRLAISWCLSRPPVACTIVGSRTVGQIQDAAIAGDTVLPAPAIEELDALTAGMGHQ